MRRIGWLVLALAVLLVAIVRAQEAPQEHRTAVVTLAAACRDGDRMTAPTPNERD